MADYYDPWDKLSKFEEVLLGILDDKMYWLTQYMGSIYYEVKHFFEESLRGAGDGISGIIQDVLESLKGVFNDIKGTIADLASDIFAPILGVFRGIGDTLGDIWGWMKSGLGNALEYIGDTVKDIGGNIMDGFINAAGSVADYISIAWEWVKDFIGGQYDKITGFWSDIFSDLWFYLDIALTEIWVYFVDVVIPVFMDALGYVFESKPVQWLVGLFKEHILSVFTELLDIDEEDLQRWIQKSFTYMKTLAEGIKE